MHLTTREEAIRLIEAHGFPASRDLAPVPGSARVSSRIDLFPQSIAAVASAASTMAR